MTPMTDISIFICLFLKLPDLVRPGKMTDLYLEIFILRYGLQGQYHGVDLLGYAIYRMFYLGLVWAEYDMENTWCDNLRTDFSMGASYEKYPVSLANAWNSTNLKWLPIFLFTSANHGMNSLSIYLFPIFFEERG